MIVRNTIATLRLTVYEVDDPAVLDGGGTVTVRDLAGAVIVTGAGTLIPPNVVTFRLTPTHTAEVGAITVEWAGLTIAGAEPFSQETREEIVGEVLYTPAESRAYDNAALANQTTFPDAAILSMRDQLTDSFGRIIGVALGLRGARDVRDGLGSCSLYTTRWPLRSLRAISTRARGSQTWAPVEASTLAAAVAGLDGSIELESGSLPAGRQNIAVVYEHGLTPIPNDLRRAGLAAARQLLIPSNIPGRALFETNQLGQFRLAVPEALREHWYGLPEVDAVLQRYRAQYRTPGIG